MLCGILWSTADAMSSSAHKCVFLPFPVVSLIHKMLHHLFIRSAINEQLQCNNERQAFACDLLVDCMVASGSLARLHCIRVATSSMKSLSSSNFCLGKSLSEAQPSAGTQPTRVSAHETCMSVKAMFDLSPAEAYAGKPPRRPALPGTIARQNFLPRRSSFLRTVARIAYTLHHTSLYIFHAGSEAGEERLAEGFDWIVHDSSGVVRIIQQMLSSRAMHS